MGCGTLFLNSEVSGPFGTVPEDVCSHRARCNHVEESSRVLAHLRRASLCKALKAASPPNSFTQHPRPCRTPLEMLVCPCMKVVVFKGRLWANRIMSTLILGFHVGTSLSVWADRRSSMPLEARLSSHFICWLFKINGWYSGRCRLMLSAVLLSNKKVLTL